MPSAGGTATQISKGRGWRPLEAANGKSLYYATIPRGAIRAIPLSGGPESELCQNLAGGSSYAPTSNGIYFVRTQSDKLKQEVVFFRFASGSVTAISPIPKPVSLGLTITQDEHLLLYGQIERRASDLMLVDNFY